MSSRSPKDIARSDMIALISLSFTAGVLFMQAAIGFARGEWLAWLYVAGLVGMPVAIVIVFRRTLAKIPQA